MKESNYETMSIRMRDEFLKYDQERMMEKFHLKHDRRWMYIRFCGREYRIDRSTGAIEKSENAFTVVQEADYNEVMSIYDVLCYSKEGCHLSGEFAGINNMKGVVYGGSRGPGKDMFEKHKAFLTGKSRELELVCRELLGTPEKGGDVCFRLPVFDFLPVILKFYDADEEFPVSLQLLWDTNVLDFVHYETSFFIAIHLLDDIVERISSSLHPVIL